MYNIDIKRISIHALLAESDVFFFQFPDRSKRIFLSTLSLRRATRRDLFTAQALNISIHALLAESDTTAGYCLQIILISIHALLAESDIGPQVIANSIRISIHALLAESDQDIGV